MYVQARYKKREHSNRQAFFEAIFRRPPKSKRMIVQELETPCSFQTKLQPLHKVEIFTPESLYTLLSL